MQSKGERFCRRRKLRFLVNLPDDRVDYDGPAVSKHAWCHALKSCDWFEVRASSVRDCIKDDVIPCISGGGGRLKECAELEWPICFTPNTVFYDSGSRWKNADYFRSPWTYSILLLNDEDLNVAWQLTDAQFRGAIARVRHFLRPSIYESDFYSGPQRWDVFLYFKSRDFHLENICRRWPNFTSVQNGYFTYEELKYKAQRSRFCIVGSCWDSYGVALHEIAAEGCPVLTCDPGTLPGNFWEGRQGLYLKNAPNVTQMGSDASELQTAAETILSWSRREIREATLAFADRDVLREQWRQALYGELPEHRMKAAPKPLVYCFPQNRYVPRLQARCIQEDHEKGFYRD